MGLGRSQTNQGKKTKRNEKVYRFLIYLELADQSHQAVGAENNAVIGTSLSFRNSRRSKCKGVYASHDNSSSHTAR